MADTDHIDSTEAASTPKLALARHLPGVSRIALGCMGLAAKDHNPITSDEMRQGRALLEVALDCGLNLFDHADIYAYGKCETLFGHLLAEDSDLRDNIFIQSKCGIRRTDGAGPTRYDHSYDWIVHSAEQILVRLGIEQLDLLLLHRPDPLMEPDEVARAFDTLQRSGKVRHFGVSNMSGHQIAYLQQALPMPLVANQIEMGLHQLDWIEQQILHNQRAGEHVNFVSGTLEYCRAKRIQLQSWGSLAQGRFSGAPTNTPRERAVAEMVHTLADKYQVAGEAIVLAWLMRHPIGVQPVVGTTDLTRLRNCSEALRFKLSREDWYFLLEAARGISVP